MIINSALIEKLLPIAIEAGKEILTIYYSEKAFTISHKEDNSPLTAADQASHTVITEGLQKYFPDVPVISEEGSSIAYEERRTWEYFWCVDPLDGTKEFINRNDEFTVNIALIHRHTPVLGIIYVPVSDTIYYGSEQTGSWRKKEGTWEQVHATAILKDWTAIGSRSHASPEEKKVLAAYPVTHSVSAGSSLKFCRIAEGAAQIYYRQGPTMEWDTAAGHAIAVYSGAVMTTPEGNPFLYNKPSLLNGGFLCKIQQPDKKNG